MKNSTDHHSKIIFLFYEYFSGDKWRGFGASIKQGDRVNCKIAARPKRD